LKATGAFSSSDPDFVVEQVGIITEELVRATSSPVTRLSSGTASLLPLDLQTTVNLITDIVSILDTYDVPSGTIEVKLILKVYCICNIFIIMLSVLISIYGIKNQRYRNQHWLFIENTGKSPFSMQKYVGQHIY